MAEWAVETYVEILKYSLPIVLVFRFSNLIVNTVLTAAFGGGLWFGKR